MEEAELRKLREERVQLAGRAADADLYASVGADEYVRELDVGEMAVDEPDDDYAAGGEVARKMASYTAPKAVLADVPRGEVEDAEQARDASPGFRVGGMHGLTPARTQAFGGSRRIADREDDYRKRRLNRVISPARNDAFTTVRSKLQCRARVRRVSAPRAGPRAHRIPRAG